MARIRVAATVLVLVVHYVAVNNGVVAPTDRLVLVNGTFIWVLPEQLLHFSGLQNLLVVIEVLQLLVQQEGIVQCLRDVVVTQILVDRRLFCLLNYKER